MSLSRRNVLAAATLIVVSDRAARAGVVAGHLPWHLDAGSPPQAVRPGPWLYFTDREAATIEALADRIIPPDPPTPGAKDAGCAVFIDRQLAGRYGHREGLYTRPPFLKGAQQQGPQVRHAAAHKWLPSL